MCCGANKGGIKIEIAGNVEMTEFSGVGSSARGDVCACV